MSIKDDPRFGDFKLLIKEAVGECMTELAEKNKKPEVKPSKDETTTEENKKQTNTDKSIFDMLFGD